MDDLDALLADLQNTISPSSGFNVKSKDPLYSNENHQSVPSHRKQDSILTPPPLSSHHHHLRPIPPPQQTTPAAPPPAISTSLNNNLNELDSLLQDLSSHKYHRTSSSSVGDTAATSVPPVYGKPSEVYANAKFTSDLNAAATTPKKENEYAPPPLHTSVKGSSGGSPASPSPSNFQPTSNSTALSRIPSSPSPPHVSSHPSSADMNGTVDSHALSYNGHPSVDSLLEDLNSHIPEDEKGKHQVTKILMEEMTTTTTTTVRPTASSATRELDDLMASLSDFKVTPQQQLEHSVTDSSSVAYSKPNRVVHQNGKQLDCMLDSLTADMSRQGVTTTQKGCCSACDKPIVGQVITALGKTWHPEHFTCTHCSQELGTRNFFERDSRPYCEPDYHNLFSPRCSYCNGPILDKCVTALEKTWHTEHFFCAQCGKQFGEDGFHEKEGKPYCKDDYFDLFAPKCAGCNRAIMENYVSALNAQWHSTCFVCRDCSKAVTGKSFYAMEGKPVCPKCVGVDDEEEA